MIYFTSDLHFGHANVIKYDCRNYKSVDEMDEDLINRWNRKVKDGDTVYILGDISWHNDSKTIEIINKLNGKKILIKGNHDRIKGNIRDCFDGIFDYKEISIDGNRIVLSHYPIPLYNNSRHGAYMLYGHVHNGIDSVIAEEIKKLVESHGVPCNMYNVGIMLFNEPVSLEEILEYYNE